MTWRTSDTETPVPSLNLSIFNDKVSAKIYNKRDDVNFDIVNIPVLPMAMFRVLHPVVYLFLSQFVCVSIWALNSN